VKRSELV
jgi:hypothetical protein